MMFSARRRSGASPFAHLVGLPGRSAKRAGAKKAEDDSESGKKAEDEDENEAGKRGKRAKKAEDDSETGKKAEDDEEADDHPGDDGKNDAKSAEKRGRKGKKAADPDDDGDDEEDDDDDGDGEDEDDGEDDDEDEDEAKKAKAAGYGRSIKAARRLEKRRCAAIFSSKAATGRVALACELAFNTSMSADAAIRTLKAAPTDGGGFAAAMDRQPRHSIGNDAPDGEQAQTPGSRLIAAAKRLAGETKNGAGARR